MEVNADVLGWTPELEEAFKPFARKGFVPGRLIRETKINFTALLFDGTDLDAIVSGKLWYDAESDADLPAVGDWVAIDQKGEDPIIQAILPRQSRFSRKMPGKSSDEHVICANVHYVMVVTDPLSDFNLRRLERYFLLIEKTGCVPVVVINKRDLIPEADLEQRVQEVLALSDKVNVHTMSALNDDPLEVLQQYFKLGVTVALVGSSGVGKSTILNRVIRHEVMCTGGVNETTGKGRHTTTSRELVLLEGGGLLVDNPGMREIQMWTDEQTLREAFTDIEELALSCKYHDCKHQSDQGCAIRHAVETGQLDMERYSAYLRLEEEIKELKRRRKKRKMAVERWNKRGNRVKARNLADRIQLERDERGDQSFY